MANEPAHIEKRRSERVSLQVPIQISGTDAQGKGFVVDTQTLLLSRYGAKILMSHELVPEQEITVYCSMTEREGIARVVGLFAKESEGCSYGIEFQDQGLNLWNISFAPAC